MLVNADKYKTEQETPAWKIFNTYISVSVQNMFLYSEDYLRHHGIISSSMSDAKNELKSEREVSLKISEVISLRNEGASVTIFKEKDIINCYEFISNHLKDWYEIISNGRFHSTPPMEDLLAMDSFCREIHPFYARIQMRKLNSGPKSNDVFGTSFFTLGKPKVYTLSDIPAYVSYIPAIINVLGDTDGAK